MTLLDLQKEHKLSDQELEACAYYLATLKAKEKKISPEKLNNLVVGLDRMTKNVNQMQHILTK